MENNENNFAGLNEFSDSLKKMMAELKPKTDELLKKIQTTNADNLLPKLIKECIIDKNKAKIILYVDNSVRIEFIKKNYGETFYNKLK